MYVLYFRVFGRTRRKFACASRFVFKWIRTWSPISVYLWRGRERWLPKVLRRSGMGAIRDFSQVRDLNISLSAYRFLRSTFVRSRRAGHTSTVKKAKLFRFFATIFASFAFSGFFSKFFFWSAIAHFPFSQFVGGVLLFLLALLRSRQSSRGVNNKPTLRVFLGDLPGEPS